MLKIFFGIRSNNPQTSKVQLILAIIGISYFLIRLLYVEKMLQVSILGLKSTQLQNIEDLRQKKFTIMMPQGIFKEYKNSMFEFLKE